MSKPAFEIEVVKGDITTEQVDAIVNAANSGLRGGGGVDGAIHRAGGPQIMEECRALGGCPTGDAKLTTGGKLSAKFVIHAVGPIYHDGKHGEPELLASCFRRSLEIANEHKLSSISFPAISCGVYGYPIADAARVAMDAVRQYFEKNPGTSVRLVRFVLFSDDVCNAFRTAAGV